MDWIIGLDGWIRWIGLDTWFGDTIVVPYAISYISDLDVPSSWFGDTIVVPCAISYISDLDVPSSFRLVGTIVVPYAIIYISDLDVPWPYAISYTSDLNVGTIVIQLAI